MAVQSVTNRVTRGFTILELLVVLALVGVILVIVITNTNESREQSQNTAVIAQAQEYQKAFQLYFAETGSYPNSTALGRTRIVCLGEGAPLDCLDHRSGVYVDSIEDPVAAQNLQNHIDPYMPSQPHILQSKGGVNYSSPAYSGCTDFINPGHPDNGATARCTNSDFSIWFVLKGTDRDCGRSTTARSEFAGVYTLCRLQTRD